MVVALGADPVFSADPERFGFRSQLAGLAVETRMAARPGRNFGVLFIQ